MMTSRVFVITLGYHEDHAIRLLTVCSVSKDDEVIALTAKPVVPAVRRAFDSLRTYLLRLGLKEPKLVEVPTDVIEGLSTIAEVFQDGSRERGSGDLAEQLDGSSTADAAGHDPSPDHRHRGQNRCDAGSGYPES